MDNKYLFKKKGNKFVITHKKGPDKGQKVDQTEKKDQTKSGNRMAHKSGLKK